MAMYYTCPRCGSNLDPGERCDCEREKIEKKNALSDLIKIGTRGQYRLNLDRMERGYREKSII
jgi:predicted  nucleic acid-binding Zn-ribbon protein